MFRGKNEKLLEEVSLYVMEPEIRFMDIDESTFA